MAEPDTPVVRKNLSEGLYIMLDENLGGGVSLQKNIETLPATMRPRILEARRTFERDVLLTPILAALERGNELEREAVLEAFDGSFFKGRYYARQPEAMIDVGNDREFGFLYGRRSSALEAAFTPLLTVDLPAKSRRQAIQLAGFFKLPGRTRSPVIQMALLQRLADPDPDVRSAAQAIVASELDIDGAADDPSHIALIQAALKGTDDSRRAVLQLIGRNDRTGQKAGDRRGDPGIGQAGRRRAKLDSPAPIVDVSRCRGAGHRPPRLAEVDPARTSASRRGPVRKARVGRCRRAARASDGSASPSDHRSVGRGTRPDTPWDQRSSRTVGR